MANCFRCSHLKKARSDVWRWECLEADTYFRTDDDKSMRFINCDYFNEAPGVKSGRHVVHTSVAVSEDYVAVIATCRDGTIWVVDPTAKDDMSSEDWTKFPDIPLDEQGDNDEC